MRETALARRIPAMIMLALAATVGLSACTGEPAASNTVQTSAPAGNSGGAAQVSPAKLTTEPAAGAKDVSPAQPVKVTVTDGELRDVTLTNPDGKKVSGELAADKHTWTATEQLGYGKTYTWAGTATSAAGQPVPLSGQFSTVTPKRRISASLNVGDDQTYGIAMPIALTFASKVTDKAAAEKALSVQTEPQTEGSWAWLSDTQVHWRPKDYFAAGTKVTVKAGLYGVKLADGAYGAQDISANFVIGRSQIVRGDTRTHRMQVIRDGQQVADYPVSYGLDSDPGRVTHSGIHVVMEKFPVFSMSNPRYHYTDVNVPWAVRISNNGEFIHGLAASMWAQGKENISHGCLNLSPARAKEYYDSVLPGDPVEITGSSQQLGPADGDYSDWTYSWSDWTKLSALAG